MTDEDFLAAFDAGRLDPGVFPHASHVRAAWLCLRQEPFRDAIARLRRGLKQLAIRAGRPGHYHETITVAYARLIHRKMRELGRHTFEQFEREAPEFFARDQRVLHDIYDQETLDSDEARAHFVPPASWNSRVVDRFLADFARYQAEADARVQRPLPGLDEPDPERGEPVSAMAVLAVSSVEDSIAWYARVFGFVAMPHPDTPPYRLALLSRAGAEMMLRHADGPVAAPSGPALYVRMAGGGICALHAELREAGETVSPLRRMPYRDVEFHLCDPDGYTIIVSELLDVTVELPEGEGLLEP